jgi:hypothetical protein
MSGVRGEWLQGGPAVRIRLPPAASQQRTVPAVGFDGPRPRLTLPITFPRDWIAKFKGQFDQGHVVEGAGYSVVGGEASTGKN